MSAGISYELTAHAQERIRQRIGIESVEVATKWVSDHIAKASTTFADKGNTHYVTDVIEVVVNGFKVITVKPANNDRSYLDQLNAVVAKEVEKMLTNKAKEIRKVDITIAEHTLNRLRAKNPNTVALIEKRLIRSIDAKQRLNDEVYAIEKAGKQYGVDAK